MNKYFLRSSTFVVGFSIANSICYLDASSHVSPGKKEINSSTDCKNEEMGVLILDPTSYSLYACEIKKYPQLISVERVETQEELVKFSVLLARVTFNLSNESVKKLYNTMSLLALNR